MMIGTMKKKDMIQLVITGFLVVILIFLIWNMKNKQHRTLPLVQADVSQRSGVSVSDISDQTMFARLEGEAKKIQLKRDPFFFAPEESAPGLYLNGIAWDEQAPRAIINNEIFQVGGKVNGNTIVDIKESKVILNDGKNDFELTLDEKEKEKEQK